MGGHVRGGRRGAGRGGAIGVERRPRPEPFGLGWPNVISIVRLLLLPVIVLLLLRETDGTDVAAAAVFAVGAFTDRLDGYLARRFDQRTATGAWLDPLSDKIFVVVPAIALSMLDRVPLVGDGGLRGARGRRHGAPVAARPSGTRLDAGVGTGEGQDLVPAVGGGRRDAAAPRMARGGGDRPHPPRRRAHDLHRRRVLPHDAAPRGPRRCGPRSSPSGPSCCSARS